MSFYRLNTRPRRKKRKEKKVCVEGKILFTRPHSILFSNGDGSDWLQRKDVTVLEHDNGEATVVMTEKLAKEKNYV